jgi:hypothetical protein
MRFNLNFFIYTAMIIWAAQRTGSSQLMRWLYPYYPFSLAESLPIPFPNLELFSSTIGACRGLDIKEVLKQDLLCKLHPDVEKWDTIKKIVRHSGNHKHVILYRENTYERLLSQMWMNNNFDVDFHIVREIASRKRYQYIADHLNPDIITYEDLYLNKNKSVLTRVFPQCDTDRLFNTKRYTFHKNYGENAELREAVERLPNFIII